MNFLIFITLIAVGLIFAVFGIRSHAFAVLSGITFILLGVLTLTSNITMTYYFVATVNNTTQIVNTTTTLLDPPMDWITPMILIFGGVAEMGVLGNRKEGGFVHG